MKKPAPKPRGLKETEFAKTAREAAKLKIKEDYDLTDMDRVILQYVIRYPDITNPELAALVNLDAKSVLRRRSKPSFKWAYQDVTQTASPVLAKAAVKAAKKLMEMLDDKDKKIVIEASKIVLSTHVKAEQDTPVKGRQIFKTTVSPDGSLIQEIIQEENEKKAAKEAAEDP